MNGENSERRAFLKAAGAVGAFTVLESRLVRGSEANSAVRVGLLGCGRRGAVHANNVIQNTGARLTALADLFPDQLDKARQRFDNAARSKGYSGVSQTYTGPHACQQIAESKDVDAVVIATPAYFHPEHLRALVEARKHVYLEKPVAVDVAGAKRVLEISRRVEGRVSLDVGFQIRSAPPFIELVRRIQAGALGEIAAGEAYYYCPAPEERRWAGASGDVLRLRNWIQDRVLSGDIIVEQNIHALDICNWVLKNHPLSAIGRGGKGGRGAPGDDCYSHFEVIFQYPGSVHVSFTSTQFGKGPFEVSERFFGTRGASQSPYSGMLGIVGDEPWTWAGSERPRDASFSAGGSFSDNLAEADTEKQKSFITSISSGQFHNQAPQGVESALTAMLGRRAAYSGREASWEELLRSNEHWDSKIDIEKLV
ncbi:MAG: Gfo/Idh/MocA family oxidoreductase [Bryobacteraceae bacterium]|jgi:predicted dehydrogenase